MAEQQTFYNPPRYGRNYKFNVGLVSQSSGNIFQPNPTLAAGDVTVSKDNGAFANLTTLPTINPAGDRLLEVTVSDTEMEAANIYVQFHDIAGDEWADAGINIQPSVVGDSASTIQRAFVQSSGFTPQATGFQTDEIREATANHLNGRTLIFFDGALSGQATDVTSYSLVDGVGQLTVTSLTEAPASGDGFIII